MTKFKVGDKVRILDRTEILFGWDLTNGKEYDVRTVESASITVTDDANDILAILEKEYNAIELVKESPSSTHNENLVLTRLFHAEAEIDELKRRVETLEKEKADKPALMSDRSKYFEDSFDAIGAALSRFAKTPNQRRADVIKRAEAFVEDLRGRAISGRSNVSGNFLFNFSETELEFHVNVEKRTIVALAKSPYNGRVVSKAFARCAPGDVFNDKIGMAIAAGRLYGVDIPQEFLDAPQPTEPVVGMEVESLSAFSGKVIRDCPSNVVGINKGGHPKFSNGSYSSHYRIKDDSEAKYE